MKISAMTAIVSAAFLFVTACPGPVAPTPSTDAGHDAAEDDARAATCANWCKHATALRCEAAKPTPKGVSCTVVCINLQDSGVVVWNLRCRISASTCALADECENGK